jgi:hypothetical protein
MFCNCVASGDHVGDVNVTDDEQQRSPPPGANTSPGGNDSSPHVIPNLHASTSPPHESGRSEANVNEDTFDPNGAFSFLNDPTPPQIESSMADDSTPRQSCYLIFQLMYFPLHIFKFTVITHAHQICSFRPYGWPFNCSEPGGTC